MMILQMEFKKGAVIIDNYKLPTFRRNIKAAGFEWEEKECTPGCTLMKVKYLDQNLEALVGVIRTSQQQANGGPN